MKWMEIVRPADYVRWMIVEFVRWKAKIEQIRERKESEWISGLFSCRDGEMDLHTH